jgi:hypothetical protein
VELVKTLRDKIKAKFQDNERASKAIAERGFDKFEQAIGTLPDG